MDAPRPLLGEDVLALRDGAEVLAVARDLQVEGRAVGLGAVVAASRPSKRGAGVEGGRPDVTRLSGSSGVQCYWNGALTGRLCGGDMQRVRSGILVCVVWSVQCGGEASLGPRDAGADGRVEAGEVDSGADSTTCLRDSDCPQPAGNYCIPCFEVGVSCASTRCMSGQCIGVAADCPGPLTDPCASRTCGDACQQCSTVDGGCYPGLCDWFGACKARTPTCSIDAGRGCSAMDASGVGDCNDPFGWAWDGIKCVAVVGCECVGSDCGELLPDSSTCAAVFSGC